MASGEILTVGHSNQDGEAFVELLRNAGVELVADVRANPRSRYPQFNHNDLAASLKEAGIDYLHLGEQLGGRRQSVKGSPNTALPEGAFRGYADHMGSVEFAAGLEELQAQCGRRRTAIMCAEADWRHCHRRLIADALVARGARVLHLGPDGALSQHHLSETAIEHDGRLFYPEPQTSLDV